jgi:hemoglobin
MPDAQPTTIYELVGGAPFFEALVARFYAGVATDPQLRPLYPEEDLGPARARLTGFLIQYFGGPDDYSQARGHPRLRMRHGPYPIGLVARERWLAHMGAALDAAEAPDPVKAFMWEYFERTATAMVNRPGP